MKMVCLLRAEKHQGERRYRLQGNRYLPEARTERRGKKRREADRRGRKLKEAERSGEKQIEEEGSGKKRKEEEGNGRQKKRAVEA